jgi:hypothetical protein
MNARIVLVCFCFIVENARWSDRTDSRLTRTRFVSRV